MSSSPRLEDSIFGDQQETRRSRRQRQRRRRNSNRGRKWVVLLIALVFVGTAGWLAWGRISPLLSALPGAGDKQQIDYPGPGSGDITILVRQGETSEEIATTLRDEGVTLTRTAYLQAASTDPNAASKIQAGSYTMRKQMTGADAFATLADPANRIPGVTIREGLWASEVIPLLSQATEVPREDYETALKKPASIGLPAEAKGKVEGWLYPSTYDFPQGTPAQEQLETMVGETKKVLTEAKVPRNQWQRTLTVASIIEAEVNGDADRAKVARVILNRLKGGGETHGLLQMDSTVHYLAKERGRAGTSDEARASNSPYNTYKVKGLPPGPIGNPGKASIVAAENPEAGNWYFFVTVNPSTGETRFAETLADHDRNVKLFNQWCRDNPDEC